VPLKPRARRMRRITVSLVLVIVICAAGSAAESRDGASVAANLINLEFMIGDLEFSPLLRLEDATVSCAAIELDKERIRCGKATLSVAHSPLGPVSLAAQGEWRIDGGTWLLDAAGVFDKDTRIRLRLTGDGSDSKMRLDLERFSLARIHELIDPLPFPLTEHVIDAGTLDLHAECASSDGDDGTCELRGDVDALDLNGVNVAESLAAGFALTYAVSGDETALDGKVELRAGAAYVQPGFELGGIQPGFFLSVGDAPIELAASLVLQPDRPMRILSARLLHPGVVDMQFSGDLGFDPAPFWRELDFKLRAADFRALYATYLQPVALGTTFGALETAGGLELAISGSSNEVDELTLGFKDVYIDDEARRFSLYGLDGNVELHAGADPRESHLAWAGGALYKVQIGAGSIDWVSSRRGLKVAGWQDVALFDGQFRLDSLEVTDFSLANTKVTLSGTLTPITLSALTSAFDWMPLSGKLSGEIPRLTYAANRLVMDGDLKVNVFDGQVLIRDLEIDKMFSTVPVLSANIAIKELDLEELTRTFSFGNISGRLDGRIDSLVLQAWQPIRFDAAFYTPLDDETPHRISRQAVDNLGRLGAGTGSALSQGWLSLIPSYSYGRLGIGCQLLNGHCVMSGVKSDPAGGFYILTRGGILPPWIDVKGTGRRIKWRTLVDGIAQISHGEFELDIGAPGSKQAH